MDLASHLTAALSGRYAVDREIARGGMATVFLARDLRHDRPVAIKVMDPTLTGAVAADRFLREIQIAARLTHPHIVPLFDSGEVSFSDNAQPTALYYVMPYVEGESLRSRMERGPLPHAEAKDLLRQVASALDYAHREGVVHRDIKPENILLLQGHAVVADFGIARAMAAASSGSGATLTHLGMMVGTPTYVSPEQATGGEVDGRADQYSLACVAYEIVTGKPPFSAPNTMGVLMQHISAPPAPLRGAGSVGESVEAAILRGLAKDPAARFGTVLEFAQAFASSAEALPTSPRFPAAPAPHRAPRLPVPLTPLVGREAELDAITALIQRDSVRLLTLHGPGGIGKTRVAIAVASNAAPFFADGVFYISLVDAADEDALRARIAQTCGVRDARAGAQDALADFFRERSALLVLDNFEQLVDHAAVVTGLLAESPRLKAVVTSSAMLRVYGEHEYPIEPLPHAPAVQLFIDRARGEAELAARRRDQ